MIQITTSELARSISSLLPLLKVRSVVLMDIDTEIFAEGFRDKIFDTEIVAALGRAMSLSWSNRNNVVTIFTAALAQGALCCFDGY